MTSSIMEALKSATATLHARTEQVVARLSPFSGLAAYAEYLEVLRALHAAWEPAIEQAPGIEALGLDLAARRKLPLLEDDLAALQRPAHAPKAPPHGEPPRLASAAAAVGAMYVLEGSTLGGQLLRRELDLRLPDAVRLGATRYLTGYGPLTGPRWKQFRAAAELLCVTAEQQEQTLSAAMRTFAAFEEGFASRALHRR